LKDCKAIFTEDLINTLTRGSEPSSSWGIVCLSVYKVVSLGVVVGMGILPREIRDQQDRVQHKSNSVIQRRPLGKCTVATLVCDHPPSNNCASLQASIESPAQGPKEANILLREKFPGDEGENADEKAIAKNIKHAFQRRTLKTVWWNSASYLRNSG